MLLIICNACLCKRLHIPFLSIEYPNISKSSYVRALSVEPSNHNVIIDTFDLGSISIEDKDVVFHINMSTDYIVWIDSSYIDTISNISYTQKKDCRIAKNYQYQLNGKLYEGNEVVIY